MMSSMRSFASGVVSKLLLGFLVITFGVWGVGDILRNSGTGYAARVDGETISIGEFEMQKQRTARQMEAMGVKNINPAMLEVGILRQLIQEKLMLLSMRDLGLYVNESLLTEKLRSEPMFQDKEGKFSSARVRAFLQAQRLSEGALLAQIGDELSGKFLLASLDMSDVTPPAPVRALMTATALETRDALVVTIAPAVPPAEISDEKLHEFYEKNKSVLYVEPESRTLEYVTVRPAQIDALIDKAVTEQMLSEAEKAQPKASKTSLKTQLRSEQHDQVMRTLQNAIDDALAGGAYLAGALAAAGINATAQSLSVTETTAKTTNDDLTKTVAEQGFMLGQGETSGLVMTPKGTPVIVQVKAVRGATPQPYEKVEADVRSHVTDALRRDYAKNRIQEVKEALTALTKNGAAPTNQQWQAALKRFQLQARSVSRIGRPGEGKASSNELPQALHQAIFEHPIGTFAGPLTLENGGQMLAIVTGIHQPEIAPQEELAGQSKEFKELAAKLNETVQAHAFNHFAEKHPIKVNQQVLSPATAPAADSDEAP